MAAIQISKNFTLEELYYSANANEKGINNTPPALIRSRLITSCLAVLQPIRSAFGKPIRVTSGYRCSQLNKAIGGSSTSQHTTGYAYDIKPSSRDEMSHLKSTVLSWAKTHEFDQIILEQCDNKGIPAWIHVGYKHLTKGQRRQILTAKKVWIDTSKTKYKWEYSVYK